MSLRATTFGSSLLLLIASSAAELPAQQRVFEVRPAGRVIFAGHSRHTGRLHDRTLTPTRLQERLSGPKPESD